MRQVRPGPLDEITVCQVVIVTATGDNLVPGAIAPGEGPHGQLVRAVVGSAEDIPFHTTTRQDLRIAFAVAERIEVVRRAGVSPESLFEMLSAEEELTDVTLAGAVVDVGLQEEPPAISHWPFRTRVSIRLNSCGSYS